MGDRNRQHFDSLAPEVVQSTENLLFAFSPKMSYVSKEFAAADPEFWNPKPNPPTKRRVCLYSHSHQRSFRSAPTSLRTSASRPR